jgi:hypothetical protein
VHLGHLTISARDSFVASGFAAMTRVACLCLHNNDAVPMPDSPTKKLQFEYQRSKTRMHRCRRPTRESGWLLCITCLACMAHEILRSAPFADIGGCLSCHRPVTYPTSTAKLLGKHERCGDACMSPRSRDLERHVLPHTSKSHRPRSGEIAKAGFPATRSLGPPLRPKSD